MKRESLATMTVKVNVEGKNRALSLSKPQGGRWDGYYEIEVKVVDGKELRPAVSIDWSRRAFLRPVLLKLESNTAITAIGFSECRESIEPYARIGPCGGCFFLWTDLTGDGKKTVFVDNWGHHREGGYHFSLWFGGSDPVPIDPQIYNQGVIHEPDPWWRRKWAFLRFFWRLVAPA